MSFTTGSSGKAPSLARQKGRGLINDLVIDAEVCEQATCEGCGHKVLELVNLHTDEAGDYRAAVAVCPERDEAFEF